MFFVPFFTRGIFSTNHLPFLMDLSRQNQHLFAGKGTGEEGGRGLGGANVMVSPTILHRYLTQLHGMDFQPDVSPFGLLAVRSYPELK